jgi:hypothetical protein
MFAKAVPVTKTVLTRIAVLATIGVLGGTGVASLASQDPEGHRSSLRATAILTDGTARSITLQGVGCNLSMCSRVAIENVKLDRLWLDGLTSIREISQGPAGSVKAILRFKDGSERNESIISGNRVLYVEGRRGAIERLDITSLARIDFPETSK